MAISPEKYSKALKLLEQGDIPYNQIAKACKISEQIFYDLVEGKAENYGKEGKKFHEEFEKLNRRRDREIRDLVKKNKKSTQIIIDRYLCANRNKKNVDKSLMSTVVSVANALAKSTPGVEIGSFSFTKGLSAEDLVNEWKRLQGIADESIKLRAVSSSANGRAGEGDLVKGAGDTASEEPENPLLRA